MHYSFSQNQYDQHGNITYYKVPLYANSLLPPSWTISITNYLFY